MSKHYDETPNLPALTDDHHERLDFEEDHAILNLLCSKLFRRAIDTSAELVLPPDIEKEALAVVPDLTASMEDLDRAREGMTDIDTALAAWKQDLVGANGQASQAQ